MFGAQGLVPKGVVLIGAFWDVPWLCTKELAGAECQAQALLGQNLCSSLQEIFSGARQGWAEEDLASASLFANTLAASQ